MERERPCVDLLYQKMLKALSQAFYQDWNLMFPEEQQEAEPAMPNRRKKPPVDYTGIGVVVMNALLCRPWWKEDELAEILRLPLRPVKKLLRLLETHCILAREHRKQKKRKRERAGQESRESDEENDVVQENDQGFLLSYSSIDYQRTYDVTRLRIHKMRQTLKAELEDRQSIQNFKCPQCDPPKIFTTLQAMELLRPNSQDFHCTQCDSKLEVVDQGNEEKGLSRKERRKKVQEKQAALEDALKPLVTILAEIENLIKRGDEQIPDFGTLNHHFAREAARLQENQGRSNEQNNAPTIDINMGGLTQDAEEVETMNAPRELPPWLRERNQNGPASNNALQNTSLSALLTEELPNKKDEEDEYMKQYKERIEKLNAEKKEPLGNQNGGWEEVGLIDEKPDIKIKEEPIATSSGVDTSTMQTNTSGGKAEQADEDDEDWEDA